MKGVLVCFLILVAFIGSSCVFFAKDYIITEQTKLVSIYPNDRAIGIDVKGKNLKIYIEEDTTITKGSEQIKFCDLEIGDSVEVNYTSKKTFGMWDYGGPPFLGKEIKVIE